MSGISLSHLPNGSKLVILGNFCKVPGEGWKVACYFLDEQKNSFRKDLPVELLPTLIPGAVFAQFPTENKAAGYTGTSKLPAMQYWEVCRYKDLPDSLKRMRKYAKEIDTQIIYKLHSGNRILWLPAIELSRMLFFQSAAVVRAAIYQGNTWQLAKSDKDGWTGEVTFAADVPLIYLNSLQFRKFFAWLLFDENAEKSFCSIFSLLNQGTFLLNDQEQWTFEFQPPDLSSCEIYWAGYTGDEQKGEKHHCYIREIRSIAGLPAPQLQTIFFSHPNDEIILESEFTNQDPKDEKPRDPQPKFDPKEIDPVNPPRPGKRRPLQTGCSGFHFDSEIDLIRGPRNVKCLPRPKDPEKSESKVEEIVGITESSDHGKNPGSDFDNLKKPELVEAPEKMFFFRTMLEKLESGNNWQPETRFGAVPRKNCRSAHLIDGRPRQYCHVELDRDPDTLIQILEIELKPDESLSTFFFRSNKENVLEDILDALMTSNSKLNHKAMQWKREKNVELTTALHYLEHPDRKIKDGAEALESWVARAAEKIARL